MGLEKIQSPDRRRDLSKRHDAWIQARVLGENIVRTTAATAAAVLILKYGAESFLGMDLNSGGIAGAAAGVSVAGLSWMQSRYDELIRRKYDE